MILLFEFAGIAALGFVVYLLFRAAAARPDQRGLRTAAFAGLAGWIAFAILVLIDFDRLLGDPMSLLRNAIIATVILCTVLGYRAILRRLRAQARSHAGSDD